jgi:PAS domain S-box-containing protein
MARMLQCMQYAVPAALLLGWQHSGHLKRALRQSQAALRDMEAQLGAVMRTAPIGIVQTGLDGRIRLANPCYCQLTGHGEARLRTLTLHDVTHPEDRPSHLQQHAQMLATGASFRIESRLVRADASHLWAASHLALTRDGNGRLAGIVAAVQDISHRRAAQAAAQDLAATLDQRVSEAVKERVAAQETLWQTQRMDALGQMAGGVAHDFNNVLQAIAGGARLIQRRPDDAASVERLAGLVVDAAERGAVVTRHLLSFARRGALHAGAVDVARLLTGLHDVLTDTLGSRIAVELALPDAMPPAWADNDQLETALANLAANARDAIDGDQPADGPRGPVHRLRLSAEAVDGAAAGLRAGHFIKINVSDTGPGMRPEVLRRAAEPFFSTKARGRGTGLGLAMAHGFAEQSGGRLVLRSQAGQGTTASLFLPQTRATADAAAGGAPAPAGPRRIMLVDDDAEVLEAMGEVLEASGYAVASFDSTAPALSHLEHGEPADLLITDLSMPDTDGVALIREAQRRCPGMPCILLTGYSGEELAPATASLTGGRLVVLQKPIRLGALLKQVATLLAEADGSAA